MVKFNYSLIMFLLSLLVLNVFASDLNFSYLNPSYENDWGFIEIVHFGSNNVNTNPAVSIFSNEMNDVSINYIYDFDITETSVKKEIEIIKKLNNDYQTLQSDRRMVIDKGFEFTSISTGATVIGLAALAMSFPIGVGFVLTEVVGVGYLLFDLVDDTFAYYSDYVELVRSASNNYNSLLYKVETNNRELIKMGITNKNYKGISSNDYSQIVYLANSIDYNRLLNRENDLKKDLKDKLIWMDYTTLIQNLNSQYYDLMHSHNSASYKLLNIYVLQEKIKKNLLEENDLLNTESQKLRTKIFDRLKYSNENFYEIDDYYIIKFSLTSAEYAITPREHINSGTKYYEEAFYEIETAKKILSSKNDNYLIDSTVHFDNAVNLLVKSDMELSNAEIKSQKIYSHANNEIILKYDNAHFEYDSFVTYTDVDVQNKEKARKYLLEAKSLIESEGKISEKIVNLIFADSKIDSALSCLNPSNVFYDNVKEDTKKSLDYLEKVISLAKKDKVDVSYEEEYLRISKSLIKDPSISLFEMLFISDEVVVLSNDIYNKSKIQYAHLDSKFNVIKNLILKLKTYDPSMNFEEFNTINSYYVNEGFDKYSSLGNYLVINSNLQILENKININKKNIIESMLIFNSVTSSNYYSQIELDVPSKLIISYTTYFNDNSLNYEGPIKIEIPFGYDPYSANEITKSNDISLSYNNKKLSILINQFDFSKVYSFSLSYDKIFAKTLNVKYSSNPISISLVQINIEREIENFDVSLLKFNKTVSYEPADIFLNGEYYGRFNDRAVLIKKPLNSGKNKITEIYSFNNPLTYSINELSSSSVKRIRVNIKNTLPFEMKKQPLNVELPVVTPSTYNFVENTCSIDKTGFKFSSTSQSSKVYFVSDYSSNGQCSFVIELVGEYNKDKIKDEIDSLLNETKDSKTKDLLDKAKKDIDSDNINNALKNIEEAKDLINEEKVNSKQNLLLELEYNNTKTELLNIILELSSIENKKVSDVLVKVEKNVNEAEMLNDINKKMLKLIAAKSELDKLKGIGIDVKLNLINRQNKLIEQWMELVNIGFLNSIPLELETNLISLNSIDFSELSSDNFNLLFSIEELILKYENDLNQLNKDKKQWETDLNVLNKQLNSQLSNLIKSVENACGNECPIDMLSIAKSNLNLKPTNSYMYSISNNKMNESILQLTNYLDFEKNSALNAFEKAKDFVSKIFDEETRKVYLRKLSDIQTKINSGNYLFAKKEALLLMNSIYSSEESPFEDNNLLLIVAGLGAIVLAFVLIKIKSQKTENIKEEFKTLKKSNNDTPNSKEKENIGDINDKD